MSSDVASNLLLNAKEHLASGDFAKAADSARGVLALDSDNVEATEILTAAEAAEAGSPQKDNERDTKLQTAQLNVQMALSGRDFFKAEEVIQEFLNNYPDDKEGLAIKIGARLAHRNHNSQVARNRKQRSDQVNRDRVAAENSRGGTSTTVSNIGIVFGLLSILILTPLFGTIGVILGIIGAVVGDTNRGVVAVFISVVGSIIGTVITIAILDSIF
jgi:hypothetical protein